MTTQAKHTAGPWRVERLPIDPDNWAICGPDTASVGRTIGSIDAKHPAANANARLIAAAPELVKSLEALIWSIEWRAPKDHLDGCITIAKEALAKATGEK